MAGVTANSSNQRVLVRWSAARTGDSGRSRADKAGMLSRLKQQGVDASDIELYGGYSDKQAQKSNKIPILISSHRAEALKVAPGDFSLPPQKRPVVRPKSASAAPRAHSAARTVQATTAAALSAPAVAPVSYKSNAGVG